MSAGFLKRRCVAAICVCSFVAALPSVAVEAEEPAAPEKVAGASEAEPTVELVEERTETTKTYETDQPGVLVTDVYSEPVHFADATGAMVEIDPTMEATSDGDLETVAAPVAVEIAGDATEESLVTVDLGEGMTASFGVEDTLSVPAEVSAEGDRVTFDGLVEDASLVLEPTGSGVKETIILDSPDAPTVWRFPLDLDGLVASIDPEWGHVLLHAADDLGGEPLAMVPHGWMTDAAFGTNPDEAASYSEGVAYTLDGTPDGLVLVVTIDDTWLADPDRSWPVSVDPTIVQIDASADDTWVTPYVTSDRSTLSYMYAGSLGIFVNHAYLHLDTATVEGKVIHYAEFKALQTNGATCDSTNVDLYQVTNAWAGLNLRWTSQPNVAATPITTTFTTQNATGGSGCTDPEWATWAISDLVREWTTVDTNPDNNNYGISLRAPAGQGVNPDYWKRFSSADATWKPHLQVIWSEPGATGTPDTPSDLQPEGVVADPYAPLSAVYTDPENDDGKVVFEIYDDTTNQRLAVAEGTTVASGETSVYTTTSPADYDRPYRIEAHAIDDNDNWSLDRATTTVTVSSAEITSHQSGDTVFATETIEAGTLGNYGIDSVDFVVDDDVFGTDSNASGGWTFDWDTTTASDGAHSLTVVIQTASGGYESPAVMVSVANDLDGIDRVSVDYQQGDLSLDDYIASTVEAYKRADSLADRYNAPAIEGSATQPSTIRLADLLGRNWDLLDPATQAAIEATLAIDLTAGEPSPAWRVANGIEVPPGDPADGYEGCDSSQTVYGTYEGRTGWWCRATFPRPSGMSSDPEDPDYVPPVQVLYTVEVLGEPARPGDVANSPVTVASQTWPSYINDRVTEVYRAVDFYQNTLGYHLNDNGLFGEDDPMTVAFWDVPRAHISFRETATDLIGAHPISIDHANTDILTVNHELFHLVQYDHLSACDKGLGNFVCPGGTTSWWLEATATWAQDHEPGGRFTPSHDYVPPNDIDGFLSQPDGRLTEEDDHREYGSVAFVEYLDDRFGADFIRKSYLLFDDPDGRDPIQIISDLLGHVDGTYSWDPTHFGEVLPDFWSAVYLLSRSNGTEPNLRWDDIHIEEWRDPLTSTATAGDAFSSEERPQRAVPDGLDVPAESDAQVDDLVIRAGGAVFIDIAPEPGFDGNLNITVDVSAHPTQTEVRVLPYHNDRYPLLCASGSSSQVQGGGPDASGTYETTIEISEACPDATVVITHIDPTGDDTITASLDVIFEDTTPSDPYDPGDLDTGFGGHGWVSDPTAATQQIVQLADGTVVAAGPSPDGSPAWVTHYTPAGLAGPAWGNDTVNGHGVTVLSGHEEILDLIEYEDSGDRYIGVLARSINDAVYVSVLDEGGDLVEDFSENGTAVMPGAGTYDAHTLMFVEGGLVVVGNGATGCGMAARFDLNGELDTGFGTDGITDIGCELYASLHPVIAGSTFGATGVGDIVWVIANRSYDGYVDTEFQTPFTMVVATPVDPLTGATGTEHVLHQTSEPVHEWRLTTDPTGDGLIIAADGDTEFTPGGWVVSRIDTTTWSLDTSFSTDGLLSLYPDIGDSSVLDIVWQDTNASAYLLVEDSSSDRSVVRINSFGSFDAGYATSGHATTGDEPFQPAALAAGRSMESTSVGYIWAAGACTDTACTGQGYGPGAIGRYPT